MTTADRINALLDAGIGLSPEAIAAIVGIDAATVLAYLANPATSLPAPGGGGSAQGVNVQQFIVAAEHDLPEANGFVAWSGLPAMTVGGHNILYVAYEAEFYCPTLTGGNTQQAGQIGAQVNATIDVKGVLTGGPSDWDPSSAWPGNTWDFGQFGPAPGTPDAWELETGQGSEAYAPQGTIALELQAQALDTALGLGVSGVKVRNLRITVAAFGAG